MPSERLLSEPEARKGVSQMQQKRHSADQIISNLRQVDVELGKGKKFLKVSNKS